MNLIYDRTAEDVERALALAKKAEAGTLTDAEKTEWLAGMKGCYNATDMNRVEAAVQTLAAELNAAGYAVEVTPVLKGGSRLPSGYTELEYIESSGTQYIDTGIPAKDITDSFIDFRFVSVGTAELEVMASFVDVDNRLQCGWAGSAFKTGMGATYSQTADPTARTTATCVPVGSPASTVYLFAQNQSNAPKWQCNAEIYSCNISTAAGKVRDFIPCKNPSGAVGLYDTVNGTFYGNSGTGVFTAGAEISALDDREWRESDIVRLSQWRQYLANVQALRDAYYTLAETGQLPDAADRLGYAGANNIEKVLADIDMLINGMKSIYRKAGTFTAGGSYTRQIIRSV